MVLKEKEMTALEDLQSQEQTCIAKYGKYANEAKDPVLKALFQTIQQAEQTHYDTLEKMKNGTVPPCDCNDSKGVDYNPTATYDVRDNTEDKTADCLLATDCIGTEKLVSSEYNTDVFVFAQAAIRKVLADIQIEEQNHAEMLFKYKQVNGMS